MTYSQEVICAVCLEPHAAGHICSGIRSPRRRARDINDICDALEEECVPPDMTEPIRAYAQSLLTGPA